MKKRNDFTRVNANFTKFQFRLTIIVHDQFTIRQSRITWRHIFLKKKAKKISLLKTLNVSKYRLHVGFRAKKRLIFLLKIFGDKKKFVTFASPLKQ